MGGGRRTQAVFGEHALAVGGGLPERDQEAFGSLAVTIVFGWAILLHHGGRQPRNHGTHVRMAPRRAYHLVSIGACTVAVDLVQTRG